jgi:hypothetical protein
MEDIIPILNTGLEVIDRRIDGGGGGGGAVPGARESRRKCLRDSGGRGDGGGVGKRGSGREPGARGRGCGKRTIKRDLVQQVGVAVVGDGVELHAGDVGSGGVRG